MRTRFWLAQGEPARKGSYTDEWGCVWEVREEGAIGEIKRPILTDWQSLDKLKPPLEILDTDWGLVGMTRAETDAFILASSTVRPFERMQFLRGARILTKREKVS